MDNTNHLATLVTALSSEDGLVSKDLRLLLDAGLLEDLPDTLRGNAPQNFQLAFEGMGGLTRLLLYADRNPGAFYKLYARMLRNVDAQPDPPPPPPQWLQPERLSYGQLTSTSTSDPMEDDDD